MSSEEEQAMWLARVQSQPEDKVIAMLTAAQRVRLEHAVGGAKSATPLELFFTYAKYVPHFRWVGDDPDPLLVVTVDGVERTALFPLFWIMQNPAHEQGAELRGMLAVLCA